MSAPHTYNDVDSYDHIIRSTLTPGAITLTATRPSLAPATVKIESHPVAIKGGLIAAGN